MPFLAQEHLPMPTKDILSWCYDNRHAYDQDKPIYVDAAHPERSISAKHSYDFTPTKINIDATFATSTTRQFRS